MGALYYGSRRKIRTFVFARYPVAAPDPKFPHRAIRLSQLSHCLICVCRFLLAVTATGAICFPVVIAGAEMIGLRKPRRRWWGWLVAIAYLFASMTPSLAISIPLDSMMQYEYQADQPADSHGHDDAVGSAVHSHDVAMAGDCDDDQDRPCDRHASCCGSVLCFTAVSPHAPGIGEFVVPRSRCEAQPDVIGDEGTFRRHYRPPIT